MTILLQFLHVVQLPAGSWYLKLVTGSSFCPFTFISVLMPLVLFVISLVFAAQIQGKRDGSRLDTTHDSQDGDGGLSRSRALELKQKGRERENQLKLTHPRQGLYVQ